MRVVTPLHDCQILEGIATVAVGLIAFAGVSFLSIWGFIYVVPTGALFDVSLSRFSGYCGFPHPGGALVRNLA